MPGSVPTTGSGTRTDRSRRTSRARSMSRQMRPTTVVSQPRRLSIAADVGAAEPQPRLLHGVLGLAERAEHAVGDGAQLGAMGLEAFGEVVVHGHIVTAPCDNMRGE